MAERRSTKAEVSQRIDEIYMLLLTRLSHAAICRHAAGKWQVTTRQTDRYIARARERTCALLEPDLREQLAQALGAYDTIFAKQMAAGDLRGARVTLKDIVDLHLALPPELERRVSIEDIDREIAHLEAKLAAQSQTS
jgi:hypothetical protein